MGGSPSGVTGGRFNPFRPQPNAPAFLQRRLAEGQANLDRLRGEAGEEEESKSDTTGSNIRSRRKKTSGARLTSQRNLQRKTLLGE